MRPWEFAPTKPIYAASITSVLSTTTGTMLPASPSSTRDNAAGQLIYQIPVPSTTTGAILPATPSIGFLFPHPAPCPLLSLQIPRMEKAAAHTMKNRRNLANQEDPTSPRGSASRSEHSRLCRDLGKETLCATTRPLEPALLPMYCTMIPPCSLRLLARVRLECFQVSATTKHSWLWLTRPRLGD